MRYRAECHECAYEETVALASTADARTEQHTEITGHRTSYQGVDDE